MMVMLIFITLISRFWWLFLLLVCIAPFPYVSRLVQAEQVSQAERQPIEEDYSSMKFNMGGQMMSIDDFPPRYRKQIEEQLRKER